MAALAASMVVLCANAAEARAKKVALPAQTASPQEGNLAGDYPLGAVVINTTERRLYYSLGGGKALIYKVAVGKAGFQWYGQSWISQKTKNPGWYPTARMRRAGAPKYVAPGPRNPLGPRAMYLGWSEYRIHGTNAPGSVGGAASSGCFRMLNADAIDLFERVAVGAPVFVIR